MFSSLLCIVGVEDMCGYHRYISLNSCCISENAGASDCGSLEGWKRLVHWGTTSDFLLPVKDSAKKNKICVSCNTDCIRLRAVPAKSICTSESWKNYNKQNSSLSVHTVINCWVRGLTQWTRDSYHFFLAYHFLIFSCLCFIVSYFSFCVVNWASLHQLLSAYKCSLSCCIGKGIQSVKKVCVTYLQKFCIGKSVGIKLMGTG